MSSPGLILINQTLGSSLTVIDNRLAVDKNADPLYETPAGFLSLFSHLGKRPRGGGGGKQRKQSLLGCRSLNSSLSRRQILRTRSDGVTANSQPGCLSLQSGIQSKGHAFHLIFMRSLSNRRCLPGTRREQDVSERYPRDSFQVQLSATRGLSISIQRCGRKWRISQFLVLMG